MEYTMAQAKAFSGAIDRSRRRREIELALVIRIAQHAEPQHFAEFLNPPKT